MKKTLILSAVMLLSLSQVFADTKPVNVPTLKEQVQNARPEFRGQRPPMGDFKGQKPPKGADFEKRKAEFEKRLNLTDEQKKQAEEMRKQGFEKMKPVMEKMQEKRKEAESLKGQEGSSAKLEQLKKEMDALRKESHRMHQQNMKDFESILDKKQLKELNTMKEEGRKKFEQMNKQRTRNGMPPRPPKDKE